MLAMMLNNPIKWNIYKCWSLKKKHFPTDCFLIEISLKRILLGAQKGYPPWVVPSPQIKTHTPRLENLHPSIQFFFFLLGCLCNCFLLGRLHLHVLYFQPVWFQRFLVAWLIMLIWNGLLSLQDLCFHWVQAWTIANQTGYRGSLWLGSSCWQGDLLSLQELCKLHYCQPKWFQRFFVAWLLGSSCW